MIITGNPTFGLAKALHKQYPNAKFCSRSNGFDLSKTDHMFQFANECLKHDVLWDCNECVNVGLVDRIE